MLVCLEGQAKYLVRDSEIAVAAPDNCRGPDCLHLLGHDTDIGGVAAMKGEAIEAKAIVELAEKDDVVLERDI